MTEFNFISVKNGVKLSIKAENEFIAKERLKNMITETGVSEEIIEQFILE